MKNRTGWATIIFVVLFSLVPLLAFGQDEGGDPEPNLAKEFVGLLFSGGATVALLQLIRRTGIVATVPGWARPLIATAIGFGAVSLSSYLGMTVDLSSIEALFAGGGGATLLFALGKELGFLKSTGGK